VVETTAPMARRLATRWRTGFRNSPESGKRQGPRDAPPNQLLPRDATCGVILVTMTTSSRTLMTLASVLLGTALVSGADYKITVSQDRLINAMNEPQNWLLMNGNYGSTRYSKLTQINRDNVKNLRMVWAMALGG